jgi:phage gpG-like protein
MRLEFEVHGEKLVSRNLLRLSNRITDASPAFEHIAGQLLGWEGDLFDSEGDSAGRPWAPLRKTTLDAKLRRHQDPHILVATGALRDSLTMKGAEDQTIIITPSSLTFGSTVPHARFHQRGTDRTPQRRPLDLSEANRKAMVRTLQRHVLVGVLPPLS